MLVDLFVLQFTPEKAENPYISSKSEVSKIILYGTSEFRFAV